jgi:hypothetical protein
LKHSASPRFWALYEALPREVRDLADKSFELLKSDSRHPSLHFKKIDKFWSVRVGAHYRALGVDVQEGVYWIWIGTHADYDKLLA